MPKPDMFEYLKKGVKAETVNQWMKGWLADEKEAILEALVNAGPEHSRLLEVQAHAKVVLNLQAKVQSDITTGKSAEKKIGKE